MDGDVVLADVQRPYVVDPDKFAGKSHNTPYGGMTLTGRVKTTIRRGKITYQDNE